MRLPGPGELDASVCPPPPTEVLACTMLAAFARKIRSTYRWSRDGSALIYTNEHFFVTMSQTLGRQHKGSLTGAGCYTRYGTSLHWTLHSRRATKGSSGPALRCESETGVDSRPT